MNPLKLLFFCLIPHTKLWTTGLKKAEQDESTLPLPHKEAMPANPPISKPEETEEANSQLRKNVTKNYRVVQIRKLLHQIEKTKGSVEVTSIPNLEDLLHATLTNTRKKLPNEEVFFTFLFDNGMGHFVKNRSKIDLYYKHGPWYQV